MVERSRTRHTVLLIEANWNLARIMGRALQDHGFVVTEVTAGREALEILNTQYPDAVVLDPDVTDGAGPPSPVEAKGGPHSGLGRHISAGPGGCSEAIWPSDSALLGQTFRSLGPGEVIGGTLIKLSRLVQAKER
jgi:hypothetical protein